MLSDEESLRSAVVESLLLQGFSLENANGPLPVDYSKEQVRDLHLAAVTHKRERARLSLGRKEGQLLRRIANGHEVQVDQIAPKLVEVLPGSEDELLFRYAALHWSIPVSSGYGRRLRFVVLDEQNDKLMGILGLGDPVFNLGHRDRWIGWDKAMSRQNLKYAMDLFALGAVPPYSLLLGGKLIALLSTSDEVREVFRRKYAGRNSLITQSAQSGELAMLTTTSALGRSSVYNRLSFRGQPLFISVGYTQGFGDFQFLNGLYAELAGYAAEHLEGTAKHDDWGRGFRNRREVVGKVLQRINLSPKLLRHGVHREVFAIPLAENTREFLRGETADLKPNKQSAEELFEHFRQRWLQPRSLWDQRYQRWRSEEWRLWGQQE